MIPIRNAAVLPLFATFACLSPDPAHADDARKYGAWTAACTANAYCTTSTRLSGRGAGPYAYLLRVSRFDSGAQEIVFLPAAAHPAAGTPISVAIDAARFTLEPDSGYRRVGSGNTYVLDAGVSADLLRAMRKGRRVTFAYATAAGKRVQAEFPLNGFAQAAQFAGIEAPAAPAPAASASAPKAAAAPTPAPEPAAPAVAPARADVQPSAPASAAPVARDSARAAEPGAVRTLPGPALDSVQTVAQSTAAATSTAGRKRIKAVQQFACRGNEPAWSLVIDHDTARYLALGAAGEPEAVALQGKLRVTGEGRTPDVDWRGKASGGAAYRVLIQEQACTDTMADAGSAEGQMRFPYRARLTLPGGRVVEGCCTAGLETAQRAMATPASLDAAPVANLFGKQPDDWSRFLLEMMPAIDACLARTPGESPYVTKAWPMNRGMVGVRTRNAVAGWFDCVAEYDGRTVERFEAVTADAGPLPGEGYVLFTPIGHAPLGGNCWRHERVVDLSSNALGWLSTNGC